MKKAHRTRSTRDARELKILCISDVVSELVYSKQIKARYSDVDCVISAGDVPMPYLGFIASSLNVPLLFVFGNHNLKRYRQFNKKETHDILPPFSNLTTEDTEFMPRTFGVTYLRGSIEKVGGLLIGGLGGSHNYNNGPNQYTEFGMALRIIKMVPRLVWNKIVHGTFIDILVTHAAPRGINDLNDPCHQGFKCFLGFMRLFKPRYLLHGHIHLYDTSVQRKARYIDTEVINVYSHYILQCGPEKSRSYN